MLYRIFGLYLFSLPVLWGSLHRMAQVMAGQGDDPRYLAHPWLTLIHLAPGMAFFLLGPLQVLVPRGAWHRLRGRTFVAAGILSGAGVVAMVWVFPALGGVLTQLVTTAVCLALVGAMLAGVRAVRRRDLVQHRRLMLRAYGLGLSVAAARWILIAAAGLGFGFAESFVAASALGLASTVLVVEVLLRQGKRAAPAF